VTAIRAADTDGNPDTVPDATWTPLITTPNHPSYGSNHAAQSRAAAEALAAFFGTDHVRFTATWDVAGRSVDRSFNKFTDAAKEAGKSRIYAGIHWSFDSAAGEQLGRKVGQYVADHYFQPLTEALARWQAAGVDTSAPHVPDARSADPGGLPPGNAAGPTLRQDDKAAAWGWFLEPTPWDDREFTTPGNQGEQHRMDLLTVPEHEVGHLLGHDHQADGLMARTPTPGTRREPGRDARLAELTETLSSVDVPADALPGFDPTPPGSRSRS
jgi:hypothetical protein